MVDALVVSRQEGLERGRRAEVVIPLEHFFELLTRFHRGAECGSRIDLQGRRPEQRTDLDAMEAVADALNDDGRRAHVACRRSFLGALTANYHAEERLARQAMTLAERCGDHALRLLALQRLAYAHANLGDPATGKSLAQQGLAEARSRGLRFNEALFLNALSVIANQQDDLMGFLELTQRYGQLAGVPNLRP